MMKTEAKQIVQELRLRVPELFQTIDEFEEEILYLNIEEMLRWEETDEMTLVPGNVFFAAFDLTEDQYDQFLLFESLFVEYIGTDYSDTSKTHREILSEIEKICEEKNVSWEEANEIYFEGCK